MLKIDIHGMKDGEHEITLSSEISESECMFEEFSGFIELNGRIRKVGNRYSLKSTVKANANLVCDRSLKNYNEIVNCEVNLAFIANTKAFLENSVKDIDSDILIREDAQYIDITHEAIELLALSLPMKRVAPEYKNKDITEIFPELTNSENATDERWSKLKDFKIN
ncbi:MAG TPA: DUF177 domain-containing protein [Candidatus Kapabacteria bacterium]|nr:DUF177 domain-containing protein [Candidatus Kapabacteria bacterium]